VQRRDYNADQYPLQRKQGQRRGFRTREGIQRRQKEVVDGQGGESRGQQSRPQAAEPSADCHCRQHQQERGLLLDQRAQLQLEQQSQRDGQHGDAVTQNLQAFQRVHEEWFAATLLPDSAFF
jgi:hypothetical protein